MRAKFRCSSITDYGTHIQVTLNAATDDGAPENERYHKYTPNGQLVVTIDNPALSEFFTPANFYYLDFTEAS